MWLILNVRELAHEAAIEFRRASVTFGEEKMIRVALILLIGTCVVRSADSDVIRLDPSVLVEIPKKRHAALTLFAFTAIVAHL